MNKAPTVRLAYQQGAQEPAFRQASRQSQGRHQPTAIICSGLGKQDQAAMGIEPSMQLGTCPTVNSEAEDEAV